MQHSVGQTLSADHQRYERVDDDNEAAHIHTYSIQGGHTCMWTFCHAQGTLSAWLFSDNAKITTKTTTANISNNRQ